MALTFSEGSIGGDIERVNLRDLEAFYGGKRDEPKAITERRRAASAPEPTGSNGIAIAPSNTANKHALLLINPHTSFFFRSEVQVSSDEGLNAYGAVTWGQFFVYQGFNERVGWMHTSSGVDNIDEYAESIVKKGDSVFYQYGKELRPLVAQKITRALQVRQRDGDEGVHGLPHARTGRSSASADGKWISVRLMQEPVKALTQSYTPDQGEELRRLPASRWTCTRTRRTTRSSRAPTATSRTSTRTSSRSAIRSSTGRSRWTAATRRPSGASS